MSNLILNSYCVKGYNGQQLIAKKPFLEIIVDNKFYCAHFNIFKIVFNESNFSIYLKHNKIYQYSLFDQLNSTIKNDAQSMYFDFISLLYSSGNITNNYLLQENGDFLLQENGDKIIL